MTRDLQKPVALVFVLWLAWAAAAPAVERVDVVTGPKAPRIEQFAAAELADQFKRLFGADVVIGKQVPRSANMLVLVGNPDTNPVVDEVLGKSWPKISQQGIVLKSFAKGAQGGVVVGGGSPAATLRAVYELGHRFGIRYLLRSDIYPAGPQALKLDGLNTTLEPTLAARSVRLLGDSPLGTSAWGLTEHRELLRQLAKLNFNRVVLDIQPWHPFLHYEAAGRAKQTGVLWRGHHFAIDGDTPGRSAFAGAKYLANPDIAYRTLNEADIPHPASYKDAVATAQELLRGIVDAAHRVGMTVGLQIRPLAFPPEFAAVLSQPQPGSDDEPVVQVDPMSAATNTEISKLVRSRIEAVVANYPDIDALYLALPQKDRRDSLAYLSGLLKEMGTLSQRDGGAMELAIDGIDALTDTMLAKNMPRNAAAVCSGGSTLRRLAQHRESFPQVDAPQVQHRLVLPLSAPEVGVLSQSSLRTAGKVIDTLRQVEWDGYQARFTIAAELDPTFYYLSRVAYHGKTTPRSAHDDLFVAITGKGAATERIWLGLGHMEVATELLDRHESDLARPDGACFARLYQDAPLPDWWKELVDHSTQTTIELYRSHSAADSQSRKLLFYYAKRGEYVGYYLAAVQSIRDARAAAAKGDSDAAIEQIEAAVESMYSAIDSLGDVAQDQSDRGLIAVLTEHAYRPLLAEYERLLDAEDAEE